MKACRIDRQRVQFVMHDQFIDAYISEIISDLINTYGEVQIFVREQQWQ